MDDCSFGASSVEEMKTLVIQIQHIFDQCSLPTHKYFSNSREALEGLASNLCTTKEENSVLGSLWNSKDDTLSFNSFAPPLVIDNLEGGEEVYYDVKSEKEIDSTLYTK